MKKKVLILSSSPRVGGNSDLLCDQFAKGAAESGNAVEKVSLAGKRIHFCRGCLSCHALGHCVDPDDADVIAAKMVAADVLVFATPVYFYSMCGQLKTLIDRTVAYYESMEGKEVYYLVTAWDPDEKDLKSTIEAIRGFTVGCLPDAKERGSLIAAGVTEAGEVRETGFLAKAFEMGKGV
jgi:multimeric flavodoxin WrbA